MEEREKEVMNNFENEKYFALTNVDIDKIGDNEIDRTKHSETHGASWDAIGFENIEFILNKIEIAAREGKLLKDMSVDKTNKKLFYLLYPNAGSIRFCLLLKSRPKRDDLLMVAFYPLVYGIENEIAIIDKYKWKNKIEGEVTAIFNDNREISFFAPFFSKEFEDIPKRKIKVFLSGLVEYIKLASEKDIIIKEGNFYNVALNDFLADNPTKTKNDFPHVKVRIKGTILCIPSTYSSYYEFRSTIQSIETVSIVGIDVLKMKICLLKDEDKELNIFIYVAKNREECKKFKVGCDIEGIVMLRGYINNVF